MKLKKYRKKILRKRGKLATVALVAVPLLLVGGGSAYFLSKDKSPSAPGETSDVKKDGINFSPPTKEEQKTTERYKKNLGSQTSGNTTSSSTSKKVQPVITSSGVYEGSVEVGSRVPGVFESNGTCTLKLSKGGAIVTKSQKATQNVSEMSCGFITIPTSKLSSGNWSATISYKSAKYSGQSDPVSVKVQ